MWQQAYNLPLRCSCGDSGGCVPGCTGFETVPGWDATTGWGSPNATALIEALVALK